MIAAEEPRDLLRRIILTSLSLNKNDFSFVCATLTIQKETLVGKNYPLDVLCRRAKRRDETLYEDGLKKIYIMLILSSAS